MVAREGWEGGGGAEQGLALWASIGPSITSPMAKIDGTAVLMVQGGRGREGQSQHSNHDESSRRHRAGCARCFGGKGGGGGSLLEVAVHLHAAAVVDLDADVLEAQPLGEGPAACQLTRDPRGSRRCQQCALGCAWESSGFEANAGMEGRYGPFVEEEEGLQWGSRGGSSENEEEEEEEEQRSRGHHLWKPGRRRPRGPQSLRRLPAPSDGSSSSRQIRAEGSSGARR